MKDSVMSSGAKRGHQKKIAESSNGKDVTRQDVTRILPAASELQKLLDEAESRVSRLRILLDAAEQIEATERLVRLDVHAQAVPGISQ